MAPQVTVRVRYVMAILKFEVPRVISKTDPESYASFEHQIRTKLRDMLKALLEFWSGLLNCWVNEAKLGRRQLTYHI